MTINDEIESILKKNEIPVDDEVKSKIDTMIHSIKEDNQFYDFDYILNWFIKKRQQCDMIVEEIPIMDLDKWEVDENSGNIKHESNGFFEIIGVKAKNTFDREVGPKGWTQPIIAKNPGGILGLLMKKVNDIPHYLVQAKAEPGNIGKLQISPTLQATTSNLLKEHGGSKPLFAKYFDEPDEGKIIYAKWQSEDGGRFLQKSNYNMIVEIDEEIEFPDSFIWMTLFQIKKMLQIENMISPHIRGIISVL